MKGIKGAAATGVTAAALALAAPAALAQAKDPTIAGIEEYRKMLGDENPAELYEARGAALWKKARGPKNVSLEKCDLGLGPGVVAGAYAQTPRYFADADRVQDIESRIVWCMMTEQGFSEADVRKRPFGSADKPSDIEDLVTYVVTASKGVKLKVPTAHPKEKAAYELGKALFSVRAGPYDFSCATCHGEDGKRIRLQELGNLTTKEGAGTAMKTWPSYRVSQGAVWTMERRLIDCMRQARFPEPKYLSDSIIALQVYLQKNATGTVMETPGIKR